MMMMLKEPMKGMNVVVEKHLEIIPVKPVMLTEPFKLTEKEELCVSVSQRIKNLMITKNVSSLLTNCLKDSF